MYARPLSTTLLQERRVKATSRMRCALNNDTKGAITSKIKHAIKLKTCFTACFLLVIAP